jgi:hypothetical protein
MADPFSGLAIFCFPRSQTDFLAMLRSFNLLPPTVPTLLPDGSGLSHGPKHVVQRVNDAGGTSAAWICWSLWNEFSRPGEAFEIPVSALGGDPLDDHACQLFQVERQADHESEGAGYLLFADLSLLIVRRAKGCPWGSLKPCDKLEVLPVVFRIAPTPHTKYGTVRLQAIQNKSGISLEFSKPLDRENSDVSEMIQEHINREVAAWAAWIPRMPAIDKPGLSNNKNTDWPAFFPRPVDWLDENQVSLFKSHVIRAVQSVMAWDCGSILQVQISAWSSRPLQGGSEPMQLSLNWNFRDGSPAYDRIALKEHVHGLIFGPDTQWAMDDFPGLTLFNYGPGSSYSANVELFSEALSTRPSGHERLNLTRHFPAPPGLGPVAPQGVPA